MIVLFFGSEWRERDFQRRWTKALKIYQKNSILNERNQNISTLQNTIAIDMWEDDVEMLRL